jgi:outer membrane pore protein F
MMKRNILAVVIPALLVAGAANAAEIYNKNGNKLDFYGKWLSTSGPPMATPAAATPPMPVSA